MAFEARPVAHEVAQVAIRPRRLAYLITAGDERQMRRAISYATTEWGGISHPIVPVRKGGAIDGLWRQVCADLDVDVVVDFAGLSTALRQQIGVDLSATVADPLFFDRGYEPGIHTMVAVDPGSLDQLGLLTAGPDSSLLAAAALGIIPPEQEEMWAQSGALFRPEHSLSGLLGAQLYDRGSSIGLTSEQLPTFQAQGFFSGAFIVICFRRFTVRRAVFFWNMRALCARFGWEPDRIVLMPPDAFSDAETIQRLQVYLKQKKRTSPNFILFSESPEGARALGTSAGFREPADKKLNWPLVGQVETDVFDPLTFLPNIHPAEFVLGKRRDGKTRDVPLAVTRPKSTLYVQSPTKFNTSIGGRICLDVRGVSAWTWPRSNEVAKLIHRDATAVEEGFSLVTSPSGTYRFEFEVPEPADVCTAFLRERGWTWSHSDKGRYAAALIDAHGLEELSILTRQRTLDVVSALASTSRPKAEQLLKRTVGQAVSPKELERVVSQILPYGVRRWMAAGDLAGELKIKKRELLPTLTALLQLGLVERALEFDCQTCGLSTFVPIEDARDRVRCPGCRAEDALVGPARGEPVWAYSLNSLLDRTWEQNCLDHVVLVRWLWESNRVVWGSPGADVKHQGRQKEVDVLALSHTELLIAEMKPAHSFTDDVITERLRLAKALGAQRLILSSLDAWPTQRLAEVREWPSDDLILEVVDGSNLLQ